MDPVGAHDDIGFYLSPVGEAGAGHLRVGFHTDAAGAQLDDVFGQGGGQHVEQIGPMGSATGGSEAVREGSTPGGLRNDPAAAPVANQLILGFPGNRPDRRFEVERAQGLHRVGAERHAGADLFELGRGLVGRNFEPTPPQRVGGRQAADATADNRDARCSGHVS